jgi:ATP-dependent RNA helicase RhlE
MKRRPETTFADFQLLEPIQRAIQAEQYHTPTPIQAEAIPHVLAGRDVLGCAQTGTGKTAAFALPILHRLDLAKRVAGGHGPRALVLCPTRELASQIHASFATYGRFLTVRTSSVFGGVGQHSQVLELQRGVDVLVATPGRLLDLLQQGHVRLQRLNTFVLDEADRMLDMGFLPDLRRIIARLPAERQSLFFSATMPEEIEELANSLLCRPVRIMETPPSSTVERIEQQVFFVERSHKRALLCGLLRTPEAKRVLVFTRTKRGADKLARELCQEGIHADAIHGGKSQSIRQRVLGRFRAGKSRILVATDVAARGIDIDYVSHVINFDMPREPEDYVHRIGRTGRAGAGGTAISLCDAGERCSLSVIERRIARKIAVRHDHAAFAGPSRGTRDPQLRRVTSSKRPQRQAQSSGASP